MTVGGKRFEVSIGDNDTTLLMEAGGKKVKCDRKRKGCKIWKNEHHG